jgi:hypothetical protein
MIDKVSPAIIPVVPADKIGDLGVNILNRLNIFPVVENARSGGRGIIGPAVFGHDDRSVEYRHFPIILNRQVVTVYGCGHYVHIRISRVGPGKGAGGAVAGEYTQIRLSRPLTSVKYLYISIKMFLYASGVFGFFSYHHQNQLPFISCIGLHSTITPVLRSSSSAFEGSPICAPCPQFYPTITPGLSSFERSISSLSIFFALTDISRPSTS